MFISYAQNFEDVILNRVFKHKKNGFYIDVGANHPIYDSVTMAFYERGWKGINIEPIPSQFELFVKDRPRDINLNIAISDKEEKLEFFDLKGTGFSTLDKDIAVSLVEEKELQLDIYKVNTRSLSSVCVEFVDTQIDFLKIDVEGWEEYVISGHDWEHFRPTIVIVEATFPGKSEYRQTNISEILESSNYQKVYFDGLNDFYLADESKELSKYFNLAPNVFDDFQSYKYIDMKNHANNLAEVVSDRETEIQNHIAENDNLKKNVDNLAKVISDRETEIQNHIAGNSHLKRQNIILDNYLLDEKFENNRLTEELKKISLNKNRDLSEINRLVEKITSELTSSKYEVTLQKEEINAMKTSKFWKLRARWFKIKKMMGLPCD